MQLPYVEVRLVDMPGHHIKCYDKSELNGEVHVSMPVENTYWEVYVSHDGSQFFLIHKDTPGRFHVGIGLVIDPYDGFSVHWRKTPSLPSDSRKAVHGDKVYVLHPYFLQRSKRTRKFLSNTPVFALPRTLIGCVADCLCVVIE